MADLPVLFSASMVRALLDGRKLQTRRILKDQPGDLDKPFMMDDGSWHVTDSRGGHMSPLAVRFRKGDRLYVREAIGRRPASFLGIKAKNGVESAHYIADDEEVVNADGFNICPWWKSKGAIPGIHMPRWASRLTLTVTDVRVQRLQEISEADAVAEGWPHDRANLIGRRDVLKSSSEIRPRYWYAGLWELINGTGSWDANPWIVALTFTVEKRNIDAARAA